MTPATHARLLVLSDRLYRRLLIVYPPTFRQRHGPAMAQLFRDICRDALHQRGWRGLLVAWTGALTDLVASAIVQDLAERGRPLAAAPLPRLAGLLAIAGSLAWATLYILSLLHVAPTRAEPYAAALALLLPGLAGLLAWEGRSLGRAARVGAALAGLGIVGFALSAVGGALIGYPPRLGPWRDTTALGATIALIAMVPLALGLGRRAAACRLGALLMLPYATLFTGAMLLRLLSPTFLPVEPWPPRLLTAGLAILFGLGWARLGLALWRAPRLAWRAAGEPPTARPRTPPGRPDG
jgi:hypothetical protein